MIEDNSVFCVGGGMVWIDLVLLFIEWYCGNGIVSDIVKFYVFDLFWVN